MPGLASGSAASLSIGKEWERKAFPQRLSLVSDETFWTKKKCKNGSFPMDPMDWMGPDLRSLDRVGTSLRLKSSRLHLERRCLALLS